MIKNTVYFLLLSSVLFVSCTNDPTFDNDSKCILQLLTQDAQTSPTYQGALAFAEKLAELSSGTMGVNFNKASNITQIPNIIEPVVSGRFDIVILGYANLYYAIPELELIAQAYVVRDYNHFVKILESDYGKKINKAFNEMGLTPSGLWYVGTRHTTSNKPIRSLEDFKNIRLRTPPLESIIVFAQSMGAAAMPISFSQLYDALSLQYVDAQENPLAVIEATKIYEVQKYIAMTSHCVSASTLFINKNKYDSFSEEQAAWYDEAIEYGRQVCVNLATEQESYLLDKFQNEYKMIVTYPDTNELQSMMKPRYEELEKLYGEGSLYKIINIK